MHAPLIPAPAVRNCARCGKRLADNDSHLLSVLTSKL